MSSMCLPHHKAVRLRQEHGPEHPLSPSKGIVRSSVWCPQALRLPPMRLDLPLWSAFDVRAVHRPVWKGEAQVRSSLQRSLSRSRSV